MTSTERTAHVLVWLNVAIYGIFGAVFLVAPGWGASQLGIELQGPTALADFRAIYGGLPLGLGLCFAAGLRWRELLLPTVAVAGVCSLELALARVYSWLVSGTPDALIFGFMALELGGALWAASIFARLRSRDVPGDRERADLHAMAR